MLELAQNIHRQFLILLSHARKATAQFGYQFWLIRWCIKTAGIEQLIQQQRILFQELADPGTGARQAHQLRESKRILHQ